MTSLSSRQIALFVLVFISLVSSATAQSMQFGSKVGPGATDEGRALSPFYFAPVFAYWDIDGDGTPDLNEPVYIHINPMVSRVSKNDVRITPFGAYLPGSKVNEDDTDYDKDLKNFGTGRIPAEFGYLDVDGDASRNGLGNYSIEDPVYLELNHGSITAGDVRITGYGNHLPGSRITNSPVDTDSGLHTYTLPGMLCFYNADGDINNAGWAIYGTKDSIYLDTQYPFYTVTPNDIRMSGSA